MYTNNPNQYSIYFRLIIVFVIVAFSSNSGYSISSNVSDTTKQANTTLKTVSERIDFYGSLRFKAGSTFEGQGGLQDAASRIGFKGRIPITAGIDAIARLEVGVGLIGNKTKIRFNGDPGGTVGEIDNVFTSRLGFVGIETKYGSFCFGKQWSVYYDVASFTDMFYAFGADASGIFAAGTDGSISGTGRAANAFQYKVSNKTIAFGMQFQNRNISPASQLYLDTYAASLIVTTGFGLKAGIAYNKVRDGIDTALSNQPKAGDEALIAGLKYSNDRIYLAADVCSFTNHEKDDLGNYFSGMGLEVFGQYRILVKYAVYGGCNFLMPESAELTDKYRLSYVDAGVSYDFGKASKIFAELKLEDSKNHDGSDRQSSVVGFGMYFNF